MKCKKIIKCEYKSGKWSEIPEPEFPNKGTRKTKFKRNKNFSKKYKFLD